ncbi:DUF481 domain-containing protein [Congregibacter litoralis]|uniref:Putative salt-induced outer membrane protein n=1 Tax=Congregibacter litoralis KT71 TaxID=314285 RepID=A4A6I9_9GAMM|nr:DUF481 domain-containing protein [Congregibacter litoralis]EAQ98636.1 putative salt-induced outer membrane protein [Congregibacter litoralis KT71]
MLPLIGSIRRSARCAIFILLFLSSGLAQANVDRIELVNGSVIIGSFHDADNGKVMIDTDFAGMLTIEKSNIVAMDVVSNVTLQMKDGAVLATDNLVVDNRTLSLTTQGKTSYALDELLRINPEPWELGRGYRHTGLASSAFSLQRGNTILDELDYRVDTRWSGLKDRYTLKLEGEVREANKERNAENWMVTGKYDRFQTGDYYWGISASAEEDRFADLDLRTAFGPYLGRSLLVGTPFVLELETGLSQVNEDFGAAADRSYVGLTWSVRSESQYFGEASRLYVDHKGVKNLADRNNLILNTTVGLAFPLLGQIQGATEVVLDYNSGAVEGTEELDQTYRFRLGYTW